MRQENNNGVESYWQWPAALAERIPQVWFVKTGLATAAVSGEEPAELLDAHAQRLVSGQARPVLFAQAGDEIADLTHLAGEVALAIRPIRPAPAFRRELRQALLSTHRQQAAQRRLFAHPLFERGVIDRSLLERLEINSPLFWQIAAAVPVLIAVAALIWRFSRRPVQENRNLAA
jgi:hypothetical protein